VEKIKIGINNNAIFVDVIVKSKNKNKQRTESINK